MSVDKFKDQCGVFGIYDSRPERERRDGTGTGKRKIDVAQTTYLGLYALQHRGEESAGIAVSDGSKVLCHRGMGLVSQVFDDQTLDSMKGHIAIGHTRYSTAGGSTLANAQPILVNYKNGQLAMAHNGNLVNSEALHRELENTGSIFQTTTDTEIFFHLLARSSERTLEEGLRASLGAVRGAYSLVTLTKNKLIGIRDHLGFRPLCLGEIDGSYCLASETSAFDQIGAKFIREVEPGEMVVIDGRGIRSERAKSVNSRTAFCVFELIYFARPDSFIFGRSVSEVRKEMGRELAREFKKSNIKADLVTPVPDAAIFAALGFAEESGIPYQMAIFRNHYVGRTFIHPDSAMRSSMVRLKQIPLRSMLEGKRVVVVDDTIVRGTTSRQLVKAIRRCGAKEVHLAICAPPTIGPCFYGIDTPTKAELIASSHTVEEIRKYVRADTLNYLSMEGLMQAVRSSGNEFCAACFSGRYPIEFDRSYDKDAAEIRQLKLFEPENLFSG